MSTSLATPAPRSRAVSCPLPQRHFLGNRFVYCVLSQRAGGLSVGINLNPDKSCNFDCSYCEVDRSARDHAAHLDVAGMMREVESMLGTIHAGHLGELGYSAIHPEQIPFKEIALSGDGEPTLAPEFLPTVQALVALRRRHRFPDFKLVLITNTSGLPLPTVREALSLFDPTDEVWAKLDAGTQPYMDRVNRADISLTNVLANIADFAVDRPVVIQSLFPLIDGKEPPAAEILAYAERLRELAQKGAQISLVQIYSAHRPAIDGACSHLSLRALSRIAQVVRQVSQLPAEVF